MSFGISIGDVLKLCELAGRVYKNCRDCSGEYKALTSQARTLTNLLEDIQDKYDKIPESKRQQLIDAYQPCIEVLEELDKLVLHYNGLDTKTKRAWDRLKYDPEKSRNIRERLIASVSMLNSFYTSLIHDSQVLILEALERLEKDYKGGHREESIASIGRLTSGGSADDDDDDEEAWSQILRDLEDVGVSQQQALSYRDVIVDWLVTAVNEGRLLEERPEHDALATMSSDLGTALPEFDFDERPHSFDVPAIVSPACQRSHNPPTALPLASSPPITQDQQIYLAPSATSRAHSTTSLRQSQHAESEASSLCAEPHPASQPTTSMGSNSHAIRRVPVQPPNTTVPITPTHSIPIVAPTSPTSPSLPVPSFTAETGISGAPPSYYEKETSIAIDLEWTAQQIVAAWTRNDFVTAEKLLEEQLAAVERGQTSRSGTQPDRRILRHLLGVCASYTGKYAKAKSLFESVFNGIYLNRQNLDDGDIAAARWLGDVCLHIQQHTNAALAYCVAYEGSIGRLGVARDRTSRIAAELRLVDHWLWVFKRIEATLELNMDPTNIFTSTNVVEKSNLMMAVRNSVYDMPGIEGRGSLPPAAGMRPSLNLSPRPQCTLAISEGFLLGPLISTSTWPLPWDHLFCPVDAVQLDRFMGVIPIANFIGQPLSERQLPSNSLGDSKKLHFLTKRGSRWLIDAVKRGLHEMGIDYGEHKYEPSIVCRINQQREGVVFSEGIEIGFSKLPFRDVYGIKVSHVKWATRRFPAYGSHDTANFRNIVKGFLERAEAEADLPKSTHNMQHGSMGVHPQASHASPDFKRPSYA
ncbi:hypothetical protein BKA58DRAFT_24495 [Alternaria rosae]|uniref:uncharacterized protein n=1 Tax=Alternaria rosae TaxID=1187941 RepID=UPI001E8EBD5E|nr:uncharacterized protein BKA58DRAFT_24495 [Alternaria rosae]KAH6882759.1 hypothetical protein BKA58DRAFT_24495 [Alternaria rosae]